MIDRATDYVRRSQKPDGSFRYALGRSDSSRALTAAAIATLNATGIYDNKVIARALGYLDATEGNRLRNAQFDPGGGRYFPFYETLYTAQALFQHRKLDRFRVWFPKESAHLRGRQRGDGSWKSRKHGAVYATAMTMLVLQLPSQYLPIFQR